MYDAEIDAQVDWFERNMLQIGRTMRNRINSALNQFTRKGGSLEFVPQNVERANLLYQGLMQELDKAGYTQLVSQLQGKENDLLKAMRNARPTGAVPLAFTTTTAEKLKSLNVLYTQQFASVGSDAMQKIASIVMDSVVRGADVNTTIKRIAEAVDNNLIRYARTYAQTSTSNFVQAVEYANAADYEGEKLWEYQGPLDNVTRPACIELLAQAVFTDEERIEKEAETASEREYNCRHDFILITQDRYDKIKDTGGA